MFNLLRMDFYRVIKSRSFWTCLSIIVLAVVAITGMFWYMTTPDFSSALAANMSATSGGGVSANAFGTNVASTEETLALLPSFMGVSQLVYFGQVLVEGGSLGIVFTLFIALFMASEFDSGFIKNIFTAQSSKVRYFLSKLVVVVVTAAVFLLVGFGVTIAGAAISGFDLVAVPLMDMILWVGLVVLVMSAWALLVSLVIWLSHSKVAGIIAAIVLASGLVATVIQSVLSLMPSMSGVGDYLLYTCMTSLALGVNTDGGLSAIHICGVGIVVVVVVSVASLVVLKKRDI